MTATSRWAPAAKPQVGVDVPLVRGVPRGGAKPYRKSAGMLRAAVAPPYRRPGLYTGTAAQQPHSQRRLRPSPRIPSRAADGIHRTARATDGAGGARARRQSPIDVYDDAAKPEAYYFLRASSADEPNPKLRSLYGYELDLWTDSTSGARRPG